MTNPSSSFFYVLTAAHGLHLVGGIVALLYVSHAELAAFANVAGDGRRCGLDLLAFHGRALGFSTRTSLPGTVNRG